MNADRGVSKGESLAISADVARAVLAGMFSNPSIIDYKADTEDLAAHAVAKAFEVGDSFVAELERRRELIRSAE